MKRSRIVNYLVIYPNWTNYTSLTSSCFDIVANGVEKIIVQSFGYTGSTIYPSLREVRSGFYL